MIPLFAALAASLPEPDPAALALAAGSRFLHDDCGLYTLDVVERNDLGLLGDTTMAAQARARLEGERWSFFDAAVTDPGNGRSMVHSRAGDVEVPFVVPLLGVLPDSAGLDADGGIAGEGRALLDEAVAVARSDTSLAWGGETAFEGRPHYELQMVLGEGRSLLRGRQENTARVIVDPDSGRARSWTLGVHDPTKLGVARLVFLDATLDVDPTGRPTRETLRTRARVGPFGLTVDRAITYTRTGDCAAATGP